MIIFLIFLSFWLGLAISSAWIALLIVAVVFLLFVYKRFSYKLLTICCSCILLGFACSFINISYSNKNTYQGVVYATSDNYFLFNSGGERLYVYSKNHQYDIGDYLSIEGQKEDFSFTTLESSFDFASYLNKRGVYHSLTPKRVNVKFHNFIRINERRNKFLKHFNDEERSIIGGILFSDGGDSELSTSLKELHLARFLSASGIFITFFYTALKYLLKLFLQDKYAEIGSWGLLLLYGVFTFPRFSVIKVMLLLFLKWINKYPLKKKFSYLSILSGLGIFCLLMNRYLARQDAFILGFAIPLISYLTRQLYKNHKIKSKLVRYLIIYMFFLPFEALYYNKIVVLSLPLQVISTPLFFGIGLVSLFCFFYAPLYKVDTFLIGALKGYASFISRLSFGPYLPDLHQIYVLLYYFIYVVWLYYLTRYFIPLHRLILSIQFAIILIPAIPVDNLVINEVNFINVGQGDCTLVRRHNKTVLIDTGGLTYLDIANNTLIPYLKKKKIYIIDAVFITHYDDDHYGALSSLMNVYPVENIYDYYSSYPVQVGDLTFNNHNYYWDSTSEENNKSLVISFNNCHKDFLIMGDAPSYIEKEIIKHEESIPCDILKVGHHGSNTSSCDEWLTYLKPEEAVISCGKNNRFGHPNKEVVALLKKHGIKIRRTDQEGTITYRTIFN